MESKQRTLKHLGFYTGQLDGQCGPLTLAAFEAEAKAERGIFPPWMPIARAEFGVSEIVGKRHNPRVLEYHETTGKFETDEVPWCSSFANWCVIQAGLKGTNNAMARSWLRWGVPVERARYGDILIFERGAPPSGHVAFCIYRNGPSIWHLGGNQGNRVSVSVSDSRGLLGIRCSSAKY